MGAQPLAPPRPRRTGKVARPTRWRLVLWKRFEGVGLPRVLRHGFVWRRRTDPWGDGLGIRRKRRQRPGARWPIGPPRLRTLVPALTDGERHDVPGRLLPREPPPGLGRCLRPKAPPLVGFHLQTPKEPLAWNRDRPPRQMSRQRRTAGRHQAHEPAETDADRPAKARQRDVLAEWPSLCRAPCRASRAFTPLPGVALCHAPEKGGG